VAEDTTLDYIAHLRSLHARWTRELREAETANPERARHLAEALDDLERLTGRLERRRAKFARMLSEEQHRLDGMTAH
jgi:hypothetical protein